MHVTQQAIDAYAMNYAKTQKATPKFHADDKVRITRKKGTVEKGFTHN